MRHQGYRLATATVGPASLKQNLPRRLSPVAIRSSQFSTSSSFSVHNRVYDSIRIPPTFHDYLRTCSASNTLFLALFTSSACTPCRTINPLLEDLIRSRRPLPEDKFSALALAEVELDSPDDSNGRMTDLGVMWGVTSMPTLIGFGGRRADRITERLTDTRMMSDRTRMEQWINEQMQKGDPSPSQGAGGGLLSRLFG